MFESRCLAQVIGWYLLIVGAGMVLNQAHFKKVCSDIHSDSTALTLYGLLGVIVGLLIVLTHNVWVSNWKVIITIFGWLALVRGAARLVFPHAAVKVEKDVEAKIGISILAWVWVLVGLYLLWVGHACATC